MLTEAMRFLQSAQRFKKTEKVARRIEALQAVIDQGTSSDENDEQVQVITYCRLSFANKMFRHLNGG